MKTRKTKILEKYHKTLKEIYYLTISLLNQNLLFKKDN